MSDLIAVLSKKNHPNILKLVQIVVGRTYDAGFLEQLLNRKYPDYTLFTWVDVENEMDLVQVNDRPRLEDA